MAKTTARPRSSRPARTGKAWAPEQQRQWTLADGLGLTLFVVLVFAWSGTGDGSAVTAMIASVGALACLPYGIARWRGRSRPNTLALVPIVAAFVLLAWGVVSSLGSSAPWQVSVYGWLGRSDGLLTLLTVVALLVSASALSRPEVDRLITWLLAAGAVAVVEALAQLAGSPYPPSSQYSGVSGALGNPNFFAAVTAILAVLALGRAVASHRPAWQRGAALALTLGLVASSVLTQSVQGPVAFVIGVVAAAIAWSLQHRGRGRVLALSLSALAVVGGVVGVVLVALQAGPFAAVRQAQTIGYREAYWESAWRMMTGLPVFGSGPDGFSRYVAEFRTESYLAAPGSQIRVSAAHDIPLQYGATFGVVGMIAWLVVMIGTGVLLVRALLRGMDQVWVAVSVAGAWVAYLAQAMISIDAPGLKALGWLVTGLVIALSLSQASPVQASRLWMPWAAGAMGALALLLWIPSISATSSAASETTVEGATAATANPLVPCPIRMQVLSSLAGAVAVADIAPVAATALDVDPRCAAMAALVAEIELKAGNVDGAQRAADIAVETDPLAPSSWFALSQVREAQGDAGGAAEALAEAERLGAIDPSDTLDQALAADSAAEQASP